MMKQCTLCQKELPLSEFNKKKTSKDGMQNVCRECNRKRSQRYYKENREKHLEVIGKRKKRDRAMVNALIAEAKKDGCSFCGESEVCCMDFHHIEDKDFNLGGAAYKFTSLDRIRAELSKCILVCSNCHRKIHKGIVAVPRDAKRVEV